MLIVYNNYLIVHQAKRIVVYKYINKNIHELEIHNTWHFVWISV